MNFKKGFSKPTQPSAVKQDVSTNMTLYSFKQLEEDEDEEDLIANTGQYEKIDTDSQKIDNKGHARTYSASSISPVSSAAGEIKSSEKSILEGLFENITISGKSTSFLPTETTSSGIKTPARSKLETSKDLFSGLKGKITDKISRTIEEFSGDSSSNSSPEKEKAKLLSVHKVSNHKPADTETDSRLHISPDTELASLVSDKDNTVSLDRSPCSSPAHSELTLPSKINATSSVNEVPVFCMVKKRIVSSVHNDNISSNLAETHPLARSDVDDDFEDVIEPSEVELLPKSKPCIRDETSEFYEPQNGETDANITLPEDVTTESTKAFTGHHGFWAAFQQKSCSKMKQLVKRNEPKQSITTMSDLHYKHELEDECEEISKDNSAINELEESDKSLEEVKLTFISSKAAKIVQLNTEDWPLPYQKLITGTVFLFAYFIIPLPSYISGFIMGTLLASLGWALYMWLMEPHSPQHHILTQVDEPPPVPELKVTLEGQEFLYKGWMNELADYNPDDYHINKTHSVFISLEGSHLRLQRPKNAIPKRAMWDEVLPKPQFIHQRHFDLPGSKVFLLPHGLVKKRIWSKKYPICIALSNRNSSENIKLKNISSEPNMADKKTKMSDMGFEFITEEKCNNNVLYLFARTGREKEDWFKRLSAASSGKPLSNHVLEMKRVLSHSSAVLAKDLKNLLRHKQEGSTDSVNSSSSETPSELPSQNDAESLELLTFAHYMGRLMPSGSLSGTSSPTHSSLGKSVVKNADSKEASKNLEDVKMLNPDSALSCDGQLFWINALIGRCFFDFLRDKWWAGKVKEKLQRKLSKIHVPYFIEELQVTDINMGCEVPSIRHASKPYIDEQGFWVNLDITYAGGFNMTIETKMNLMKLKRTSHTSTHAGRSVDSFKSPVTDSDEEDSAESSTDEEEEVPSNSDDSSSGGGASKKLLRYLSKITQSKYFQQATEYKVIKRAMENVSNTPLILSVTVISLVGKLALNIPPPPSDRLWYGFRGNPHLRLSAKPQVGERAVTITHIVEWIEKKLATEFQRVFVIPNMDDLIIPILVPVAMNSSGKTWLFVRHCLDFGLVPGLECYV